MGWLEKIFNKNSHMQDLKSLIVEYKEIIKDLKEEREKYKLDYIDLQKRFDDLIVSGREKQKEPKKLTTRQLYIYETIKKYGLGDLNLICSKCNIQENTLKVYISKIRGCGYTL